MPLRFRCQCGQKLKTGEDLVGKRARCPKCRQWLRVPQSDTYETVAEAAAVKKDKPVRKLAVKPEAPPADEKARVVIADSVDEDRKLLATMLREHGYHVVEATDGPQAVEAIRAEKPDAIILDVKLDILSGFQVVEQIHNPGNDKNAKVWNTPVLMTTGRLRGRDKQYSMSLGVKGFFTKPLTPAQLCARLEKEVTRPGGT